MENKFNTYNFVVPQIKNKTRKLVKLNEYTLWINNIKHKVLHLSLIYNIKNIQDFDIKYYKLYLRYLFDMDVDPRYVAIYLIMDHPNFDNQYFPIGNYYYLTINRLLKKLEN